MRLSWSWLSEHVDTHGLTPAEVAERLTLSGIEVEGVHRLGAELDGVVVARVLSCDRHPNAEKLRVCRVHDGVQTHEVVCGAPNVAAGLVVPLAMLGAVLPGGVRISEATIRGVTSRGMLCSARELGLSDDHGGLLVLPEALPLGGPIADALGRADTVLEVAPTPNRGDALSVRGLAREVAALFGRRRRELAVTPLREGDEAIDQVIDVRVEAPDACGRYAAAVIRGLVVAPSPAWLQDRLRAIGQRPVNNLVDVTNYVLFEQGQPLHAFDLGRLAGPTITVRSARAGESLEAIDHVQRALDPSDLVIADGRGPVAVAGVMGGAQSEVHEGTTDVLLECAWFDPGSVRKTARRLGMHTESSHRFERGVDAERVGAVLLRAASLLASTQPDGGASCRAARGIVDVIVRAPERAVIALDSQLPARVLGVDVPADDVERILRSLELGVSRTPGGLRVEIPSFRPDLRRPIDLVEEVGRVYGLDRLPPVPVTGPLALGHARREGAAPRPQDRQPVQSTHWVESVALLRRALAQCGLYEAVHWGMIDPARAHWFAPADGLLRLRNPLGEERSVMRPTLLVGLLDGLAHNLARGCADVGLFEVGRVFPGGDVTEENGEPLRVAAVLMGTLGARWGAKPSAVDAYDLTGVLEEALRALRVPVQLHGAAAPGWLHPGACAEVRVSGARVGWAGQLHPDVTSVWEIERPVFAFELDVDPVVEASERLARYTPLARTQGASRDLALVLRDAVTYEALAAAVSGHTSTILDGWWAFDVYRGAPLAPGTYSLAVHVVYRSPSATLTDDEIDAAHRALSDHLCAALDAQLR